MRTCCVYCFIMASSIATSGGARAGDSTKNKFGSPTSFFACTHRAPHTSGPAHGMRCTAQQKGNQSQRQCPTEDGEKQEAREIRSAMAKEAEVNGGTSHWKGFSNW